MNTLITCARALAAALVLLAAGPLPAHEGHDHGEPEPDPATLVLAPRAEAAGELAELLLVVDRDGLVLHVDRFTTNEPLAGAVVEIDAGGTPLQATAGPDGVARLTAPSLTQPGEHPLIVTVTWNGQADLLETTLRVPRPAPAAAARAGSAAPATAHGFAPAWALWAGALGAVLVVAAAVLRHRRRAAAAAPLAAVLFTAAAVQAPSPLQAAPAGASPSGVLVPYGAERPQRLPDGMVFMAKPAQQRLGLRTEVARTTTLPRSLELAAEVVADPRRSGRVQAPQAGQLQPPPGGLPLPGQPVAQGQLLALLQPLVPTTEAATLNAERAELAVKLAQAERELARARTLEATVPRRTVEALAAEAEALRQRRDALGQAVQPLPLRAPVAGVVSAPAGAALPAAGQVVDARDALFDIVDPKALLVQARVPDAATAQAVVRAHLADGAGAGAALAVAGRGVALLDGTLPLWLRLQPSAGRAPPALALHQPLRVLAQTSEQLSGTALPAGSVVRNPGGESVVWLHERAERFKPVPVQVQPLDGARVLVRGVPAGARVVTVGAGLLAQVR